MINFSLYKTYCYSKALLDKGVTLLLNRDWREFHSTQRIYPQEDMFSVRIFKNFYNLSTEPTQITDNIYLGNSYNARDFYILQKLDIGYIINCTKEIPNYFSKYFKYLSLPISDTNEEDISRYLETTVNSMQNYLERNKDKSIFVHCFMGASRSVAIIIGYLIKYQGMRLDEAIEFIKLRREFINLNESFYIELKRFEDKYCL